MEYMTKVNFNNLSIDEQIKFFNINLKNGFKINETCIGLKISYNTIRDRFSRNNYIYNKLTKQYECIEDIFPRDEEILERVLEKLVTKIFETKNESNDNKAFECDLQGNVINRSFRIYDSVLTAFTRFCDESKFNQYDILSKFISDGIEKYRH